MALTHCVALQKSRQLVLLLRLHPGRVLRAAPARLKAATEASRKRRSRRCRRRSPPRRLPQHWPQQQHHQEQEQQHWEQVQVLRTMRHSETRRQRGREDWRLDSPRCQDWLLDRAKYCQPHAETSRQALVMLWAARASLIAGLEDLPHRRARSPELVGENQSFGTGASRTTGRR